MNEQTSEYKEIESRRTTEENNQKKAKKYNLLNILMPTIGAVALAGGGATLIVSVTQKSSGDGEVTKEHDIVIDTEETTTKKYNISPSKTKAKKGDVVEFTVTAKTNSTKEPKYLIINNGSYLLIKSQGLNEWKANVTIESVEKMTVTIGEEDVIETFTVSFQTNGGSSIESQSVAINAKARQPQDPTWSGHTFLNWYSDSTLQTSYDFSTAITHNLTLYAKWDVISYTITYHNVEGETRTNPTTYTVDTDTITLSAETKNGCQFDGWYNDEYLSTKITEIKKGSVGNLNLYAKWTPVSYTITYKNVDGVIHSNPSTYTVESETFALCDAIKTGYKFNGWFSDESLTTQVTEITKGTTGDKILYASWTKIGYSVVLLSGDGKFSGTGITSETRIDITDVSKDTTIKQLLTEKSITITPNKGDYSYNGNWTDGTNSYTESSKITSNLIIYPVYTYCVYAPTVSDCPSATTIRAMEDSTVTLKKNNVAVTSKIKYSTTGKNDSWTEIDETTIINVPKGSNLYLIGDNSTGLSTSNINYWSIIMTGNCNVGGSVMGLLDNGLNTISDIPTDANYCFSSLFKTSTGIRMINSDFLPATTLANNCYSSMFSGCTSLTQAPELLATTLANYCYSNMFNGCTSLTTVPNLPATTLAEGCYYWMFYGCTALSETPKLPATTLANNCYDSMFWKCSSLCVTNKTPTVTEYGVVFTCPSISGLTDPVKNMFKETGGTFTGTPAADNTYYWYKN